MKRVYSLFILLCMIGLTVLMCAGCSGDGEDTDISQKGDEIRVYFTDENATKLYTEERMVSDEDDKQKIADTLIDYLLEDPENEEHFSAIPNEVVINNIVARNNVANIDFAVGYEELDKSKDVICRAAIVKTLVQISGIDYVEFTIGGKTMMDIDDTPIGSLTSDSFVFQELPLNEEKK